MIDHISLPVSDYETSKAFYTAALAPLGYRIVTEFPGVCGMGAPGPDGTVLGGDFWLEPASADPIARIHVAFMARTHEQVKAFHEAALAAGGTDNGGPGERPQYHPGYYAAYVLDPDGHNIEAVVHGAP